MTDVPKQVKQALVLLCASVAITIVDLMFNPEPLIADDPNFETFVYILTAFLYLITFAVIYFIYRRRSWARIAYLAITAVTITAYVIWPPEFAGEPWWSILLVVTPVVLDVAALYLLFIGKGAVWYSGRTTA
jgi:hypothetical protein